MVALLPGLLLFAFPAMPTSRRASQIASRRRLAVAALSSFDAPPPKKLKDPEAHPMPSATPVCPLLKLAANPDDALKRCTPKMSGATPPLVAPELAPDVPAAEPATAPPIAAPMAAATTVVTVVVISLAPGSVAGAGAGGGGGNFNGHDAQEAFFSHASSETLTW